MIVLFILLAILVISNTFCYYRLVKEKSKVFQFNKDYSEYTNKISVYSKELERLGREIEKAKSARLDIEQTTHNRTKALNDEYTQMQKRIQEQLINYQDTIDSAQKNYFTILENHYIDAEKEFDKKVIQLNQEQQDIENELQKLKNSLAAGMEARLREQEIEQKLAFYTLQLTEKEKHEVNIIKGVETQLADPRPVRMLIWTTYYSKKANDLCSRVLGKNTVCGIYKITDLISKQCYVGQARDCKERFREHLKCGLGIDTPAGNKLYAAMQKDGIDNFSFELLESCATFDLNEKEKFYIDLYSSYHFGYNSTQGNNSK